MSITRTASGGDYFSPWITATGGQTYCASLLLKWPGTGGTPFIGIQPSTTDSVVWIIGASGYRDVWGPVRPVSATSPNWQRFRVNVTLPAASTQTRFAVELYGGASLPGENQATFDDFALTSGPCANPTVPYREQFELGPGDWADRGTSAPALALDTSSTAGPAVMSITRTGLGGDYFSPWIMTTGGETYCASLLLKWPGTGSTPFIGIQPSSTDPVVWIIGATGYSDAWGPVRPVSASNPNWQRFRVNVTLPAASTQTRFAVELYGGASLPGANQATFDDFALTSGSCASPTVPFDEQFEFGSGDWADRSGSVPVLALDTSSTAGSSVMSITRTASGGDYFSPWITATGGETYCASLLLKWPGTGGTPFIGIQPSATDPVVWIIGASGYSDAWGPMRPVSANSPNWQRFRVNVTLPAASTQTRFAVELYGGASLPGENRATFDDFALTSGPCANPSVPYGEQFELGTGDWADRGGAPPALPNDSSSTAGSAVMSITRTGLGGDYFSPWVTATGGGIYCARFALKWAGSGGTPFVGIQSSPTTSTVWIVGSAGYSDAWGPVQAIRTDTTNWQQFSTTLTLPQDSTAARFAAEIYGGVSFPGENRAVFDNFSLVEGACSQSCGSLDTDGDGVTACTDCSDADPNNWTSCGTCIDSDSDSYFVGCDSYSTIQGPDCSDADPNNWTSCGTCVDSDGDSYFVGCDSYSTILGPDCYDGDSRAHTCAKNVILFVGDGMGFHHVRAGRCFHNGNTAPFVFETLPNAGQVTTSSANSDTTTGYTDSAAAATAMATGQKVNNDVVSVALPGNGADLQTVLELRKARGQSTGLITIYDSVLDATPAAFGAHVSSRTNKSGIASDLLAVSSRPNLLFGKSDTSLLPASFTAQGYTYITTQAQLEALPRNAVQNVLGVFANTSPNLPVRTTVALDILEEDPDGFFLLVEQANTDKESHYNRLDPVVRAVVELDLAVQEALTWAAGRTDTLIVVLADHETGGLECTIADYVPTTPGVVPTSLCAYTSGNHTGVNVPVFATGVGASGVTGTIDNTDVYSLLAGFGP